MRRVAARIGVVLALAVGAVTTGGPAEAVLAGQFCPTLSAGAIVTADNGATVQCQQSPTDSRYHWVDIGPPTTLSTAPPTTISTNRTGIISISPAPTVTTTPIPMVAAPLQRTG